MGKSVRPGQVYEIADPPHGFYYGVIAAGDDVIFLDTARAEQALSVEAIDLTTDLMRLAVNHPSIRRAGWRLLGDTPVEGRLAEYGLYIYGEPQSGIARVYDNKDASVRSVPEPEVSHLEMLGAWDAVNHIPKLLRQHFFGEETSLARGVRSPWFRR